MAFFFAICSNISILPVTAKSRALEHCSIGDRQAVLLKCIPSKWLVCFSLLVINQLWWMAWYVTWRQWCLVLRRFANRITAQHLASLLGRWFAANSAFPWSLAGTSLSLVLGAYRNILASETYLQIYINIIWHVYVVRLYVFRWLTCILTVFIRLICIGVPRG